MNYKLFSVGDGQTLVSYANGELDIVPNEKLNELIGSKPSKNKSDKVLFNELITGMIIEYREAKENNTSIAGERVDVQVIHEVVKWKNTGVYFSGKYEVIGSQSKVSKSIQSIEIDKLVPAWKNINMIYRSILQLKFSGCHATAEDEYNFKKAMAKRH